MGPDDLDHEYNGPFAVTCYIAKLRREEVGPKDFSLLMYLVSVPVDILLLPLDFYIWFTKER